jgi:arylsulfatase A-like enzyme
MSKKPNIVYVLTDQWRAQAFGYSGDPNVKTPNIDALAAESVNFKNAISVCPVCTPHRASLLTGKFPTTTGMFMNDLYLPAEEYCMAEMFKESGYDTGYIGKWHLDGHGRDQFIPADRRQGFDYWKVLECTHDYNDSFYYDGDDPKIKKWDGYDAYAQTKDAIQYIEDHKDKEEPYLLFVAYGGPHFPHHSAPEELKALYPEEELKLRENVTESLEARTRRELQGYYAHCTAIDTCIGDLRQAIDASGELENTIFIFTSDHGEMMGSQGNAPSVKQVPWDESVCVPFLMKLPGTGNEQGKVVETSLNTTDILPTLLSLANIETPEGIEGDDLSAYIIEQKEREDRAVLFMSVAPFSGADKSIKAYRGIRNARYSYVRDSDGPWLLYDHQQDPYQMQNLIGDDHYIDIRNSMENQLQSLLEKNSDPFLTREASIRQWGYDTGEGTCIPYHGDFKVQSPACHKK